MFERFYEKLDTQGRPNSDASLNLASNVALNPELLGQKLAAIDTMSDKELYELVQRYYSLIFDKIFSGKDEEFIKLFTNTRFITAATQAFYQIELSYTYRIKANKMVYDYLKLPEKKRDSYTQSLLIGLSKTINRDKIPLLCGLKIPEDVASLLALARYSSDKETLNVRRLNWIMIHQPAALLTEQMVVDIYLTLFDHITPLFEGIMLDVIPGNELNENAAEVYGTITLAMFDIINELPSGDIEILLDTFATDKQMMYADNSVRVNLESCSPDDYPRLLWVIDKMKRENTYML